jgi:putative glycosyltransferase (TIGR04372 family)
MRYALRVASQYLRFNQRRSALPQSNVRSSIGAAAAAILREVRRSVRRPSRLLFVPLLLPAYFPRLLTLVLSLLPVRWPPGEKGKAFRLAIGNLVLLRYDRPEQAWFWLQRVLARGCRSTEEYFLAAVCLYQGLGRLGEATSLFASANDAELATARSLGLANSPYRVLDQLWARHIGDAATLDYVIKERILAGSRRQDTILYLPPGGRIANRFLVQQLAACFRLVEHPGNLPFNPAAVQALNVHYQFPRLPDGTTTFFWELASKTQGRWRKEGRGPLLELPADTAARGGAFLLAAGLPRGAWYVALHVRDISWKGLNGGMQGIRNADMAAYLPAIAEVTRRGGYVVRMGGPDAPPSPPLANVIDYRRSEMRSDWMDIFLIACSRFMLASASGPSFVPPLYGVPAVLTNWWPPAARPWHSSDIFVPKIPRRSADGRYLTLSETLCEPFSWCHSRRYLAERGGVFIEDNDPEIIRGAVDEMLAALDGESSEHVGTEPLRARADQIYQSHGVTGTGRLARDFLRRHGDLIT